ncbi:unnamed protein product [Cuscuta epithymum]|uniref:Non-haem dioxygenase N-terminal domain-containing protein n=1 Tax=Cuscuta epithymum TaxID=186058 RepID=A0AAV0FXD6_9ASTE|nr:unnamed protein product [Cuscuta epithymum]
MVKYTLQLSPNHHIDPLLIKTSFKHINLIKSINLAQFTGKQPSQPVKVRFNFFFSVFLSVSSSKFISAYPNTQYILRIYMLLANPATQQLCIAKPCKTATDPFFVPSIDLSKPATAKHLLVKACEEFEFFKVVIHGVPAEFITRLEAEAVKFFSSSFQKEKAWPPDPFGYTEYIRI